MKRTDVKIAIFDVSVPFNAFNQKEAIKSLKCQGPSVVAPKPNMNAVAEMSNDNLYI